MKFLSLFFVLFMFLSLKSQEIDSLDIDGDGIINSEDSCPKIKGVKEFDGCPDPKPDCTNFQIEKKNLFDKFTEEGKSIDFSKLPKIIFSNLDLKKLSRKNIILSPVNVKGYDCGVPFMYDCYSNYNVVNPNFSADNFFTKEIIEIFKTRLEANIIPSMSINNFDKEWGLNLCKSSYKDCFGPSKLDNFDKLIVANCKIGKVFSENEEQEVFYFSTQKEKLNLSNANYIMFDFKNELNNIVSVEVYYNKEKVPQVLKFQFKDKKWKKL